MSSNQMPVSDEMLAEALAYAAAESKFKDHKFLRVLTAADNVLSDVVAG